MHYGKSPKKREKGAESLFKEIMSGNFLNLRKEIYTQIYEVQRTPTKNPQRSTQRNMIMKQSKVKDKEKNLECSKRKSQTRMLP